MYVQGVSTRKVKAITEELCGHSFSASSISAMNQRLDASLAQFAGRPLAEAFPYLILDARYERVREAGVIVSQAVLIALATRFALAFVAIKRRDTAAAEASYEGLAALSGWMLP
jgi:transposase-like protein